MFLRRDRDVLNLIYERIDAMTETLQAALAAAKAAADAAVSALQGATAQVSTLQAENATLTTAVAQLQAQIAEGDPTDTAAAQAIADELTAAVAPPAPPPA